MCGRYQFSTKEYKEIQQIVRDAQRRSEQHGELNFPMACDICPSQIAPVMVARGDKIVGEFQQWGAAQLQGTPDYQCTGRNRDGKNHVLPQHCSPALRDTGDRLL